MNAFRRQRNAESTVKLQHRKYVYKTESVSEQSALYKEALHKFSDTIRNDTISDVIDLVMTTSNVAGEIADRHFVWQSYDVGGLRTHVAPRGGYQSIQKTHAVKSF